jgi:hypothetical protein
MALSFGQCLFANTTSTMTRLDAPELSVHSKSRPARSGIPSVRKYPGVATPYSAFGICAPGPVGSPSTANDPLQWSEPMGNGKPPAAEATCGSADARCRSSR